MSGIDWNDLYRTTFPELVRFLHRKVWDVERARDLAQEAFVRALQHEPKKPRAWLFQVAANLAKDEARTAIRRKKHLVLLKSDAEATGLGVCGPGRGTRGERALGCGTPVTGVALGRRTGRLCC